MSEEPIRKFYKDAAISEDGDGFGVLLDGRGLKTRSGHRFRAPTRALALACAKEWNAQEKVVAPLTMPMTRFVNVAIDVTREKRPDIIDHIVKYVGTDLICHRADTPAALAARQAHLWDPILVWTKEKYDIAPPVVAGIFAADASAAQAALKAHVESLDDFALTGLGHATGLAGSALIGLAMAGGRLDAASAYDAATVDEAWSMERWGEDAEARARLDRLRAEFDDAARFFTLLT